ncbi:DUF6179 domain-containing protein [Clostridium sp. HV4-5-A1G]|uniref:DUF6179 domain-containing protein n=1 Tax=Clostridium sp. HV4-5-A1G TaxID=2004595 RepID=UPI001F37FB68|nr:DUF6179 domain-containing protein [Clostridium sp. HV4-5-A1G]
MEGDIMSIFQNLIVKYTRGKGSSIKEDTAFRILGSIYYAVNACVQNQQDSSRSFLISKGNILEIYKKGIEILKETFCQCEKLYEEIKENRLRVPVKMYNDTIDAALPDFFKNYDIIFGAQDTYSSMDYPLVFDDMNIKGIFYIKQYLEKLKVETEFCNFFKESSILEILKGYGEKYKIDISQSPISVFQILIEQCAFLTLCEVFESLDDTFLALLGKTVFYDDLACSSFKLTHDQLINCRGNMEREWQNYYVNFLLGQSEKRIKNIGKTIIHIYG